MITKIPRKKASPRALLDYLQGEGDPKRRLLDTSFVSTTPKGIAGELMDFTRSRRPRLTDFTKHIILALAPGEEQPLDRYRDIAHFYMKEMGYLDAPYAIYLHTDTPHPHLHIVTTPTTWAGQFVDEWNDWPRSERVARRIERRFGLKRLESSQTAKRKSKQQAEVHARARKGEESHREIFQREIAEAAVAARSFPEFLSSVVERGYQVRVALDRHHELRGLSFGRDGFHFRGTQLGRAYTGGQLLTSFGLDYDSTRDRAALGALALSHPRSVTLMAVAETKPDPSPETKAPGPRAPGPRAVEPPKASEELRLPDGRYELALVDLTRVKPHPDRIPQETLRSERTGWTAAQVDQARNWLARQDSQLMVMIRPEAGEHSRLGFRDVSREQLAEMKADGVEPALVVKVGERYDVHLMVHEYLKPSETGRLWQEMGNRYGLTVPTGFYRDAVRMPGCAVVLPEGREIARLVETPNRPFSASEFLVREIREAPERQEIERLAKELDSAMPRDRSAATVALERAESRVPMPESSPLAALQARVEEARSGLGPHAVLPHSNEELLAVGQEAHRQLRDAADLLKSSGQDEKALDNHPAVRELLAVEAELSRRVGALEEHLARLEAPLRGQLAELNSQAREIEVRPDLESIHAYQRSAKSLGEGQAELGQAERAYKQVLSYQATLDRERFGAAVVARPQSRDAASGYEQALSKEERLARQAGQPITREATGDRRSLEARLASLEQEVSSLRQELSSRGHQALPRWETNGRERLVTREALDRALQRDRTEPAKLENALGGTLQKGDDKPLMAAMFDHQRALAVRSAVEQPWQVERSSPVERMLQASGRVAAGDVSPDALRRLNAELVMSLPSGSIPPPVFRVPEEPKKLVERYLRVREELIHLSREAAGPQGLDPAGRGVLLTRSSEALAFHQHVEALNRRMLGVIHPGQAPPGVTQSAHDLAWLKRAAEKGLLPVQGQSHLGNMVRAPIAAGSLATGRALWLGAMALRSVAASMQRYAHRVLTQG